MRREIHGLLLGLMALMLMASCVIGAVDFHDNDKQSVATLSLKKVEPPSDEALFMIEGAPNDRYLRNSLGITYNGERWLLEEIPCRSEKVNAPSGEMVNSPLCLSEPAQTYHDFSRDVLNEVSTLTDPLYLELPQNISDRVRDLAYRITEGMPTPFEKAKAIEEFLQVKYRYNLNYVPAPDDWEPNDWFLFESKEGICGNFNSAFVILARAAGIPARLAAGYYVKAGDEDSQAVYPSQAHAWAEVGFVRLGWLAFEAVPP